MGSMLSCSRELKECKRDLDDCKSKLELHINPKLRTTKQRLLKDNRPNGGKRRKSKRNRSNRTRRYL